MATSNEVTLTTGQRAELSSIAQSRSLPAGYVFRAKLILMLAEGASFTTIKRRLQTSAPTIIRWKQRFLEFGLDGLDTYHPGQKASVLTPALRSRILSTARKNRATTKPNPINAKPVRIQARNDRSAAKASRKSVFWISSIPRILEQIDR